MIVSCLSRELPHVCRSTAFRPIVAFANARQNVHLTSTLAGRYAQIAAIRWRRANRSSRPHSSGQRSRPGLAVSRGPSFDWIRIEPCAGTTMNVAQWLNAIDLGQYEAVFREHEIDGGVLRDLVEADLEKIGVPLGHRKRLLRGPRNPPPSHRAPRPYGHLRPPSGVCSRSCSAISSARRACPQSLTRRIGAIWSVRTSTQPRRR